MAGPHDFAALQGNFPARGIDANPERIRVETESSPPNRNLTVRRTNREERDVEIKRMWKLNWSAEYIGDQLGITGSNIHFISKRLGLPRRSLKEVRAATALASGRPVRMAPPKAWRRFEGHKDLDPEAVHPLSGDHPAVVKGRTLFPTSVVEPAESDRLLVSGAQSRKLGDRVTKGAWAGMRLFHLTLEERATCPESCHHWTTCYGNAMPFARRHAHGPDLLQRLDVELLELNAKHRNGFVVRLHNLGDFYSVEYADFWIKALDVFGGLRIFGYTAHQPGTPIHRVLKQAATDRWDRFAIRFSAEESLPGGAVTIWRKPEGDNVPEGFVCPAQTGKTDCCGTCGLCWSPAKKDDTVVFIGHGMRGRGRKPMPADVRANKEAARHLPKDAPALLPPAPRVVKEFTGEKKFEVETQRRCQRCPTIFETRDVDQLFCVACRVIYDRRLTA